MNLIVDIIISLAIVFIIAGAWLSLPAGMPFAPSQRFIDALPPWLQGPRRIAPKVKDEAASLFDDADQALEHRAMPVMPPVAEDGHEGHVETEQPEVVHDEP